MHLTLDYRSDWRAQAALFRIGGGPSARARKAMELRLRQLVWVGLWAAIAALGLHWRVWLIAVPTAVLAAVLLIHSLALRSLGPAATIRLRDAWRQPGCKQIPLEVSDDGLRETDGDVI